MDRLLTPQQELFLERYTNPKSPTFSNAKKSALEAQYSETYTDNITTLLPEWLGKRKHYQVQRFIKAIERVDKFKKESEKGDYLYIIRCDLYYKIGIASNMDARLNALQCGNPYELEVIFSQRKKNYKKLEKELHENLKQFNHKREWFLLDEELVEEIKIFIENYE